MTYAGLQCPYMFCDIPNWHRPSRQAVVINIACSSFVESMFVARSRLARIQGSSPPLKYGLEFATNLPSSQPIPTKGVDPVLARFSNDLKRHELVYLATGFLADLRCTRMHPRTVVT